MNISMESNELMYDFHVRDVLHPQVLRQFCDHAVKEIKSSVEDCDIQVRIEPEAKDKKLYLVSFEVFGLSDPIIVKRSGKDILSTLKNVRKSVLRQLHRMTKRNIQRRRVNFRELYAS